MRFDPRWWRLAAGGAVLLAMGVILSLLAPYYLRNRELQRHVGSLAARPENRVLPPELLQVRVVQQASRLGIPVKLDQVRVSKAAAGLRIDVRYVVLVEFPFYTVDLHFRASGGG